MPFLQVPKAAWDANEHIDDDATPWWSVEVLKSVSFRSNQITEIPPELFTLSDVQSMNFCSNKLQQIPPEIVKLRDLRILLVSENRCDAIRRVWPRHQSRRLFLPQGEIDGNDTRGDNARLWHRHTRAPSSHVLAKAEYRGPVKAWGTEGMQPNRTIQQFFTDQT